MTALVGGPDQHEERGGVWVYQHTPDGWRQQGAILTTPTTRPGDARGGFGYALDLSSSAHAAVISEVHYETRVGDCWVFTRRGDAWTPQHLSAKGEDGPAGYGYVVAISEDGTTVLVTGPNDRNERGAAWLYRLRTVS